MIKKRTPFSYTCCQHMSDDDHFFLESRTCVNTRPDNTWVMMIIFQRGKLLHMAHDDHFSQNGHRIYSCVRKTETFVFWHIAEILARKLVENDRTDVAHLFCFQKTQKTQFGLFFPGCVFWWGVCPTRKGPGPRGPGPIWALAHMGPGPLWALAHMGPSLILAYLIFSISDLIFKHMADDDHFLSR